MNKKSGGIFKRQVKLLKWWHRENLATLRRPKGFIMECLVAEHMGYGETSHEEVFAKVLEGIANAYSVHAALGVVPTLADPAVPGNNVFSNVKFDEFKRFYDKAAAHAKLVRRAQQETDPDEALKLWRNVFGPRFPATASSKGSLLRSATYAGLAFPPRPVLPNKPQGFA